MGVVSRSISDVYFKNKDDVYSLLLRKYPDFIFRNIEVLKKDEICVFVFHQVEFEKFEKQILFLVNNGYKTLNSQDLVSFLKGDIHSDGKHVVLTFDDGHISIFTIVYPLLKKYGLTGVSFIVPGLVDPGNGLSPNLEDVWSGNANLEQILSISSENKICNWDEIKTMHQSGIIDFQSHTNNHNCIFISDEVVDFISPWSDYSYFSQQLYSPVFGADDKDFTANAKFLGQPIYRYAPKMGSHLRFIENPDISRLCREFVKRHGGRIFYEQRNWKKQLHNYLLSLTRQGIYNGSIQTEEEKFIDIRDDLVKAKENIESKLDKDVLSLCYPWYIGCDQSVQASKAAGYMSNHWGYLQSKKNNRIGDDPFTISRISEKYLLRLPGKNNLSLSMIFKNQISDLLK
jgi:hypothetical protein